MDRLIYGSLSGLHSAMARQTATANNLANVNTTGFRGDMSNAQSLWIQGKGFNARANASGEVQGADMSAGSVISTGRDLDVSIDGDALLSVQAADGSESYTRRGDLQLTDSGLLTTGDGHPVLGEGGPITLPPADSVSISKDGTIWIVPQGGDPKAPQQVDRLKLVSAAGSKVQKGMDGLFRVADGALPSDPDAKVTSRSLEGSNVNATKALVDMIDASRAWETQVKMITTAQDLDKSSTELMQLPE